MNIAAEAARQYLRRAGKRNPWPGRIARLVDANLSLMGQRIMAKVRRLEAAGKREQALEAFQQAMRDVGIAAAREYLGDGN